MKDFDIHDYLKPKSDRKTKRDFGSVCLFGGSLKYPGAPLIASSAALKTGTGYVALAVTREVYDVVATKNLETIYHIYESGLDSNEVISEILKRYKVILFGNGLDQYDAKCVKDLSDIIEGFSGTLVIDASGLAILKSVGLDLLKCRPGSRVILTPHIREFNILFDEQIAETASPTSDEVTKVVSKYALEYGVTIALKSYHSLITDGFESYLVESENGGLSKAGSGDMLAGLIGGFAAFIDTSPCTLVRIAYEVMNLSVNKTATQISKYSITATDVIDNIGIVLLEIGL